MKQAVKAVFDNNMSLREAAFHFSVPKSTLSDKVKQLRAGNEIVLTSQMGRFKNTFSKDLEVQIVDYLKDLDCKMMPMTRNEFLKFAYDLAEYLRIPNQFNKNKKTAGKKFYYEFMARHPEFSLRCPQSTSIQRATGFNKEQVDIFFSKYEELSLKYNFSPSKLFNCDETGISVVHANATKVLSLKGKKQVSKITSGERGKNITILLAINASGDQFLPPLFVFPRKKMIEELKKDAPEGSCFVAEESGWITASGFLKWMKMFKERVNPTKESPALIILDGHSSHKDLQVILYAKENNIHMISLPPHTSHKMQPLDRAVMKPFKAGYNEACSQWMKKYCPLKIAVTNVAGLVNTAFTSICRMELAQSGFRCTGLFPIRKDIFTDLEFLAAKHFTPSAEVLEENKTTNSPVPEPSTSAMPSSIAAVPTSVVGPSHIRLSPPAAGPRNTMTSEFQRKYGRK